MSQEIITIKYDSFTANIYPHALAELPLRNIKKIFKLAQAARFENEAAISAINAYLSQTILQAQEAMKSAARAYNDGWRKVDKPRSRKPAVVEQLQKNRELTDAFKKAHAHYERLVSVRKAFDEILASDTQH